MNRNRAFTLIELLVVISIISLLASIVLASLNTAREKGRLGSIKYFATQVDHIAGEQAIGLWDLSECSGSTAVDRSGFGSTGTLINYVISMWSTDTPISLGCSLNLNGSNQYMNAGNPSVLNIGTGDLTVSVWIKTTTSSGWVIDKKFAGTNNAGFDINIQGSLLNFRIANGTAQTNLTAIGGALVSNNLWHNIVGVVNRADSFLYLYVDGTLNNKVAFTNTWNLSGSDSFSVGSYGAGSGGFFSGLIDNIHIFAKTLTASEVGRLYALEAMKHNIAIK